VLKLRQIIGDIRKLALAYRLQNGTINGITNADLNIGTATDQIPSECRSSHYFRYEVSSYSADPIFIATAWRCVAEGKTPQRSGGAYDHYIQLKTYLDSGRDDWWSVGY
jgi:hypothetical protein